MRKATVCFLRKTSKVLLALIEYPSGDRKWNGIGGFVEQNESPEAAVVREAAEEIGIQINPEDLNLYKIIPLEEIELAVFSVDRWKKDPIIIDTTLKELRWFSPNEVPYDQMHPDNDKWLPGLLE
jgi:8-oxo-dGTP diphosphatase